MTVRYPFGDHFGELAVAAADIKDGFIAFQLHLLDQFDPERLLYRGISGIIMCVPFVCFFFTPVLKLFLEKGSVLFIPAIADGTSQ